MRNMYFSIVKGNGTEVSCGVCDNGILEFQVPHNLDRKEITKILCNLKAEECNEIIGIQKKEKEKFRKKVNQMIDVYKKEFNLQFGINLRLQSKPKKLMNSQFDIYGIIPEGLITIGDILQFYPDDIVKKIVRFAVSAIAIQCENKFRKINAMETTCVSVSNGDMKKHTSYIAENEKYHLPLSKNMMKAIENECIEAIYKVCDDMKEYPILSASMD